MRLTFLLCALLVSPAWAQEGELIIHDLPPIQATDEAIDEPAADEQPTPTTSPKTDAEKPLMPQAPEPVVEPPKTFSKALLKVLNKATARTTDVTAPLGTMVRAGKLEITAHRCVQRDMQGVEDYAVLLEVRELKPNEGTADLFKGWMMSSNKAAASIQHAVVDVWVQECAE